MCEREGEKIIYIRDRQHAESKRGLYFPVSIFETNPEQRFQQKLGENRNTEEKRDNLNLDELNSKELKETLFKRHIYLEKRGSLMEVSQREKGRGARETERECVCLVVKYLPRYYTFLSPGFVGAITQLLMMIIR